MTASATRRRRNTIVALVATVVAVVVAVGLAAVGAATLRDSRAGRHAAADTLPELGLPVTPTALVGVVDDEGVLTSVAALVLAPNGVGGSIVVLPATGDSSLGLGDDRFPLAETYTVAGRTRSRSTPRRSPGSRSTSSRWSTRRALADIVSPLGRAHRRSARPTSSTTTRSSRCSRPVRRRSTPDAAASVLTARVAGSPDSLLEPDRLAVWTAVAERVGAGIGSALPVGPDVAVPTPTDLDEFLDRLFAGPVAARGVLFEPPAADANPRGVDVVVPDRAELLLVFGQIAPARVAAPNPSLTFRIETSFTAEDLEAIGANSADVAYDAIKRLLFVQANVVSVVTRSGEVPEITQAFVADRSRIDVVEDNYPLVFGDLDVHSGDRADRGRRRRRCARSQLPREVRRRTGDRPFAPDRHDRHDSHERHDRRHRRRRRIWVTADLEALELARTVARIADDEHGVEVLVLEVGDVLAITEYFVLVSASNRRLVRSLVDEIEKQSREATGRSPRWVEGGSEHQWVLIDYGDVVVHVFLAEVRQFYEIERLYRDVPNVDWRA